MPGCHLTLTRRSWHSQRGSLLGRGNSQNQNKNKINIIIWVWGSAFLSDKLKVYLKTSYKQKGYSFFWCVPIRKQSQHLRTSLGLMQGVFLMEIFPVSMNQSLLCVIKFGISIHSSLSIICDHTVVYTGVTPKMQQTITNQLGGTWLRMCMHVIQ